MKQAAEGNNFMHNFINKRSDDDSAHDPCDLPDACLAAGVADAGLVAALAALGLPPDAGVAVTLLAAANASHHALRVALRAIGLRDDPSAYDALVSLGLSSPVAFAALTYLGLPPNADVNTALALISSTGYLYNLLLTNAGAGTAVLVSHTFAVGPAAARALGTCVGTCRHRRNGGNGLPALGLLPLFLGLLVALAGK